MSRIFISHSSLDDFAAVALCGWLAGEGWNEVFLDRDPQRGIVAGERWERALHEAATRCEAVVFLVSKNWLASQWCDKEYSLSLGLNKKLLAVLVDRDLAIADLPEKYKATWQVVDLTGGQDMRVFRVPLPGSHEEAHVTFSADGLMRLKRGLEKAGLDPKFFAWPPPAEPQRAPYRGLKPLEAEDAGIFFGRGAPIVEATDRLRGLAAGAAPRLLVLLGASGAGKSSFLRAGLLPRLARDDAHFLPLAPIRPERAALTGENGFLGALAKAFPDRALGELRATIVGGADAVRPLLAALAQAAFKRTLADDTNVRPPAIVVTIDQAEELFRPEGAAEGTALLDLVRDLTAVDDPTVIVVFAIRSDSYDALMRAKPLHGLRQETQPLPPMPRGAYMDVIEGPTRRVVEAGGRLAIEPRLTERLLEDIEKGGGSDALPLLAFTLEQLYLEYRGAGTLLLAHYEAIGGLRGAIDKAVARAVVRADADGRIPRERAARETLLRRGLIPWLAGIDPDTKSPRRAIARRADIPAEAAPLIDLLVEERLLATDVRLETDAAGAEVRSPTIEPTHEALLRQWGLLDGWLKEDFSRLATLEGVQRAARDWDANARAESWLSHGGDRLAAAQALDERPDLAAKLDATDRAYLAGCRAKEDAARAETEARRAEREAEQARRLADAQALATANRLVARRTRTGFVAAIALAVAAFCFGGYALFKRTEAERALIRSDHNYSAASQAVRAVVSLFSEAITKDNSVSAFFRGDLLIKIENVLDKIGTDFKDEPQLIYLRASASISVAQTLFDVGNPEAARRIAVDAKDRLELLARSNRQMTRTYNEFLSAALTLIGKIDLARRSPGAIAQFRAAVEALDETGISATELNSRLEDLHTDLQLSLLASGDKKAVLQECKAEFSIIKDATKKEGQDMYEHELALAHSQLGSCLFSAGDATGADEEFEQAIQTANQFYGLKAGDERDMEALADYALQGAQALQVQSNINGAIKDYEIQINMLARVYQQKPHNENAAFNLEVAHHSLGNLLEIRKDMVRAEREFVDAATYIDQNNDKFASEKSNLCKKLGNIAFKLLIEKRPDAAFEASRSGTDLCPEKTWIRLNEAHSLFLIGKKKEALDIYELHKGETLSGGRKWDDLMKDDREKLLRVGEKVPAPSDL